MQAHIKLSLGVGIALKFPIEIRPVQKPIAAPQLNQKLENLFLELWPVRGNLIGSHALESPFAPPRLLDKV
jgi:hypothetical protein